MTKRARHLDPITEAMAPSAYRIQAMVDGLDAVASAMELTWGVGRLRLLVPESLRARFDEQKDRLDAVIGSGDEPRTRIQVDGMRRAWEALDRTARTAGEKPLAPEVWECVLPSTGEVVSLVRTATEAHRIARDCRVFTVAEVAKLIDALGDEVLAVKRQFPGAAVTAIRSKPPIDWERGDEIPF